MFRWSSIKISNQPVISQQFNAFRHVDVVKKTFWSSNWEPEWEKKRWLNMWLKVALSVVPDRLVWVFQKLMIYWDFPIQPSLRFTENGPNKKISTKWLFSVWKCLVDFRGQRRSVRLLGADNLTSCYNLGVQKSISVSSSRRPYLVPLLSTKNRKLRLPLTWAHQNWTTKHCKHWNCCLVL